MSPDSAWVAHIIFGKANTIVDDEKITHSTLTAVLLIAACAVGAVLRFYGLELEPVTRDEAFSWRLIQYDIADLIRRTGTDVHPPLYYLMLKAWAIVGGTGMLWLRSMSCVLGVASIVVAYILAIESCRLCPTCLDRRVWTRQWTALCVATFVSLHACHIEISRSARMYQLGVFLSLVASYVFVRAMHASSNRKAWHCFYGIIASTFLYTHNFAVFTLIAQVIFVVGTVIVGSRRTTSQVPRVRAIDIAVASLTAAVVYSPWLATACSQVLDVRAGFWIPQVTMSTFRDELVTWISGTTHGTSISQWLAFAFLVGIVIAVRHWDSAVCYYALHAVVPLLLAVITSIYFGTSLVQHRYLAFSQAAVWGLVGILLCRSLHIFTRFFVLWMGASLTLWGAIEHSGDRSYDLPSAVHAFHLVQRHYKAGDVVVANSYLTVNQIRCYGQAAGIEQLDVRCVVPQVMSRGRVPHWASLNNDDVISLDVWMTYHPTRVWCVALLSEGAAAPPPHMRCIFWVECPADRKEQYTVALYSSE